MANIWTITYGGVTKTTDAWGIGGMTRTRTSGQRGEWHLPVPGRMDAAATFAIYSTVTIKRDGVPWWTGPVIQTPRDGTGTAESRHYVVADPWWYLEDITFQQMWQAITGGVGGGLGTTTESTTVSRILATQALDGTKLDLTSTLKEVLIYALYAEQMVAFPDTVGVDHLPAIPAMTGTPKPPPFQIGTMPTTITVPYFEVRDRTCAEIILHLMRFIPDVVMAWDMTTSPPTINFRKRADMAGASAGPLNRTIKALTANLLTDGYGCSGFKPDPQYTLQVPVVVLKYEQTNSIDGVSKYCVLVDSYPPAPGGTTEAVWRAQRGAFVQTIDLVGSNITFAKQTVTVRSRPSAASTQEHCMEWLIKQNKEMADYDFTVANITATKLTISAVTTVVDVDDPALGAPYDMPADGTGYNYEIVKGAVAPWMWEDDSLLSADAHITFTLTAYTGTDKKTLDYMASQNPPGTVKITAKCKITNAGGLTGWSSTANTEEYTTIASFSAGESAPAGNAEALYNVLSVLHQKGSFEVTERGECSDMLPVGCVFNTVDGLAEWQTMNALVLSVTEDFTTHKTKVTFGPTLYLGAQDMVELRRANRGRLPTFALDQRTTGETSAGATVQGHDHSAASNSGMPPGGGAAAGAFPFEVIWRTNPADPTGATFQSKVQLNSNLLKSQNLYDNISITGLDTWTTCTATDTWWLLGTVSSTYGVTSPTIHNFGNGDTDYVPGSTNPRTGGEVEVNTSSPPTQTAFRKVIATSTAVGGKPSIKQYVQTDLVLKNTFQFGAGFVYPSPL